MKIVKTIFGRTEDGKDISAYTLENASGMKVTVSEFGGIVSSIIVPDKNGKMQDVVLGYDSAAPYFENNEFFGATIGRSANRVAGASFELDGQRIELPRNEGDNNLHSDSGKGFHKRLWTAGLDEGRNSVVLSYVSPDMENGFPGTLDMHVTFSLTDDNSLVIHYEGVSDRKTLINCTNHSYFNLSGNGSSILDHRIQIFASHFTPVDAGLIPTGEIAEVKGTAFDFQDPVRIGEHIDDDIEQLRYTGGFDHNFVLDEPGGLIAAVEDEGSGRRMEVYTDLPGVQFYAGNFIRDGLKGKDGLTYGKRSGLCLETQYFPNSVNQEGFKSPVFDAGVRYDTSTTYKFMVV
ncbi:MAG: galactose mutarotase [Lachnospiraceae bacterium]|nr:galactose mutarotase [Lachnospiraceae bacterium]